MTAEAHPDPFQDAMGHGLQRAVQVTSCAVTAAQVYLYQQRTQARTAAERDERTRRALTAQSRADREAARVGWAPALDPDWLRQADLFQAARTWGAAMPYAERSVPWYEPAAATAMRKSEERLRDLHPYAMARYDRLRGDGMGPAEAMLEAALLFARPPQARDTPYTPRPVLDAGNGENLTWAATDPVRDAGELNGLALAEVQERRGRQIIATLQERARATHRGPLGEAEQRTVLETLTNLPTDIIDRIVRPDSSAEDPRARNAGAAADAATDRADPAGRPWQHDFPTPIQEVVAATASPAPGHSAASAPAKRRFQGNRPRSRRRGSEG
jgi:hypothetical protein